MMKLLPCLPVTALILAFFGAAPTTPAEPLANVTNHANLPGLRPDGSVLLPNQWSLRPAGKQVPLGDFPVNIAVHPDGRYAAVLHSGHGPHEIVIVDLRSATVVSRTRLGESFYGLEFSSSGARLYCSGGGEELIHVFDFKEGQLATNQPIHLRDAAERGIPSGLAVAHNARSLYVANVWGQSVSEVDLFTRSNRQEILLQADPGGSSASLRFTNTAPVDPDVAAITKRAAAALDPTSPAAPFPYACRLDEGRQRLYVSLWAQAGVAVIDLTSHQVVDFWPTGEHPNEMILTRDRRHLFVANANQNTVTILATATGRPVETLQAAFTPDAPPGSTPNSLALSPDENTLFVANACNNNIAVFDVHTLGRSRSLGFIPVGWYPTSVRVTPDGRQLLVANGKGTTSAANPRGPRPGVRRTGPVQSISELFPGSLSIIDLAAGRDFPHQLAEFTTTAFRCTPPRSVDRVPPAADNPIPHPPGGPTPIKYCVYIIKENRTYDQVLGDMPGGNGDTNLCLFPRHVTPNHHKIAGDFVLLDNFFADAEVSADGHEWSMAAYATDFVEKTWPLSYGHNRAKKYPYPSEGQLPIAASAGGYLWDRARAAGVTYRSYGEFTENGRTTNAPATTRMAALKDHFDPWFHGFDTSYPDTLRAQRFVSELHRFETEGEMPRLQIVRLPNDHTAGTGTNQFTPTAYLGDNDVAFGTVVAALSRSKFWPQMAIFVIEDDAQDGPDHVDAHRTIAFAISPYIKRGSVDSTMYSTTSMVRTIELILGLQPMTQFDAAAAPMYNAFQAVPDLRPYDPLPANVDLHAHNQRLAWGSEASRKMDFSKEDAADDHLLNEIVWHSVRGPNSPMPAPRHSAFLVTHAKGDSDGD